MKTGSASLELGITLEFDADGALSGVHSIDIDGHELPVHVSKPLYELLYNIARFDRVRDDAWEDAEESANHESDEAAQ